ncbi:MAG: ribonuclease H-like domain-containing protein [Chloroflexi bacterium]|nr:ribonuclease H-like domain-containing protein [Chloroflexota bacterium]
MSTGDLRERLRRLGVKQGRDGLKPRPPQPRPARHDLPGHEVETTLGPCFVVEKTYPLDHQHGTRALAELLECDSGTAARLSKRKELHDADLSGLAFFDIETTGLAGGAGTLAFLIGVGLIQADQFILRQYFLREPKEEKAMLAGVADSLVGRVGLVTYNGRSFDVPIVQSRFTLNRRRFDLASFPNLDLLHPARRLWRGRYENCSLGTLEGAVLGLARTEDDVPGALIPQMYVNYLHTGDASEMLRVIYHNAEDILSMVTLATHILETFADPLNKRRSGEDCLRLAMWHDDAGESKQAEAAYRAALDRPLPDAQALVAYERFATFLKRADRRAEATALWQSWAELAPDDPTPCIELAKYYEWDAEARDMAQAKEWASRALLCLSHWRKGWQRDEAWKEVKHRLERLGRKMDS